MREVRWDGKRAIVIEAYEVSSSRGFDRELKLEIKIMGDTRALDM
jgi:hypothetical protein